MVRGHRPSGSVSVPWYSCGPHNRLLHMIANRVENGHMDFLHPLGIGRRNVNSHGASVEGRVTLLAEQGHGLQLTSVRGIHRPEDIRRTATRRDRNQNVPAPAESFNLA